MKSPAPQPAPAGFPVRFFESCAGDGVDVPGELWAVFQNASGLHEVYVDASGAVSYEDGDASDAGADRLCERFDRAGDPDAGFRVVWGDSPRAIDFRLSLVSLRAFRSLVRS